MKIIYKGELHRLTGTKKLDINKSTLPIFEYEDITLKRDVLLYNGLFGTYISLEHRTRLPDYNEAKDYILQSLESEDSPVSRSHCTYLDYEGMQKYKLVTNKELREMKKEYQKTKRK